MQAAKRVFEFPFIFPTTGAGHVPCYPCCLVPNSKFVQGFMPEIRKRCHLECQGRVKQISLESNACSAVHVSSVVPLLFAYATQNAIASGWSCQKEWLSPSGSRFWCLSWSGILVFLKAESIKLMNCDTSNSKPPSKAPCHRFALPTTGRPWSARGMKMPNCLAGALNMCPQIWNSEVVGFPRVPVFSSNWKPKIIPALLFTLLFPVFQNQFLCHLSSSWVHAVPKEAQSFDRVRTQKRSLLLEEMEPERPLV